MDQIAGWWDGFELWVAGLPFIPQFLVVLVGMVPISFAIAVVLDRVLRVVMRLLGRDRAAAAASAATERAVAAQALRATPSPALSAPDSPAALLEPAQSGVR